MIKATNLRLARQRAGLTQQEAADALGYSLEGYSKKERGERKMSADFIKQAAEAFGCDPADILNEVTGAEEAGGKSLSPVDPEKLSSFVAEAKERIASLSLAEAKELVLALISAARKP